MNLNRKWQMLSGPFQSFFRNCAITHDLSEFSKEAAFFKFTSEEARFLFRSLIAERTEDVAAVGVASKKRLRNKHHHNSPRNQRTVVDGAQCPRPPKPDSQTQNSDFWQSMKSNNETDNDRKRTRIVISAPIPLSSSSTKLLSNKHRKRKRAKPKHGSDVGCGQNESENENKSSKPRLRRWKKIEPVQGKYICSYCPHPREFATMLSLRGHIGGKHPTGGRRKKRKLTRPIRKPIKRLRDNNGRWRRTVVDSAQCPPNPKRDSQINTNSKTKTKNMTRSSTSQVLSNKPLRRRLPKRKRSPKSLLNVNLLPSHSSDSDGDPNDNETDSETESETESESESESESENDDKSDNESENKSSKTPKRKKLELEPVQGTYYCPYCPRQFTSFMAIRGHVGGKHPNSDQGKRKTKMKRKVTRPHKQRRGSPSRKKPVPDFIDEDGVEKFIVEEIRGHRKMKDGSIQYQVKWQNKGENHMSFIDAEDFDSGYPVSQYWQKRYN